MRCTYCGTELPAGAMFCGECGRAVAASSRKVARVQVPTVAPASRAIDHDHESVSPPEVPANWHWGDSAGLRCEHCGAQLGADEIFCPDCGAVSQTAIEKLGSRDTAIIEPVVPMADEPEPVAEQEPELVAEPEQEPEPAPPPAPVRTMQAEPLPAPAIPFAEPEDFDGETRIVGRSVGERFVLQFSTGESSTVSGTGLIGRNPLPEPGEYFDQLVRVVDPSRSVSKTHLEFGQEEGAFWVMDRYSGNGTVLREPDSRPIRCQPERRYRIMRGTRVEIGEQFFIVS